MANPADTTYSIIRETIAGVTPATPAFKNTDALAETSFEFEAPMVTSDALKANRGVAANRRAAGSAKGTLATEFRRDAVIDMLIEGAIGGAFGAGNANEAVAGSSDFYHTIEQRMIEKGTPMFFRYAGLLTSGMSLSMDPRNKLKLAFPQIGMSETKSASAIVGSTYTTPTQGVMLIGSDAGQINLGGANALFNSLDFNVEMSREPEYGLFNNSAIGVSTGANRNVKLTLKVYRRSLDIDTLLATDAAIAVSFTIGGVGAGYKFEMPAMVASFPKNEVSGNSGLISIELMAQNDANGVDLKVTRL